MLKKFSILLLTIFVISSSFAFCLAHEEETPNTSTSEILEDELTSNENTTTTQIHKGNLYLSGDNIVMDKNVDGNVFIFGNNVTVTGQIDGNLFVFTDELKLDTCSVKSSIFACANSVYYNAACNNLFVYAKNLETTWYSYIVENAKISSSDVILRSAIGGNVDLSCDTLDLGEGIDIPEIHGNLNYSATNEATIPEGVLAGDNSLVNYTPNIISSITSILLIILTCVITVLIIYIIINRYASNLSQKLFNKDFSITKILKNLLIGLVAIICAALLATILVITKIGIIIALIFILLFAIICIIAVPTLAISITNSLKPVLKIEKNSMFYLILSLVTIVLYCIPLIPAIFAGLIGIIIGITLELIINITAIGTLIVSFLPHKELTEEEKEKIQEAKENKQKRKQEKLELKAAKKQEKSKNKENKEI